MAVSIGEVLDYNLIKMKLGTNKIIPVEIQDLILAEFTSERLDDIKTGRWSFVPHLTTCLNRFLERNKSLYPSLKAKFSKGVSQEMIKRAFNKKSPCGASKELRDLLCYYATNGKMNWNEIIISDYSKYLQLIDAPKALGPVTKRITLQDIWIKLEIIEERILNCSYH